MAVDRSDNSVESNASSIALAAGLVRVRDESLFGQAGGDLALRFLGRVFSMAEVDSITIDRKLATASIRHQVRPGDLPGWLGRLASAIRDTASTNFAAPLPTLPTSSPFSIYRHGGSFTTWEVIHDVPGRLRLRHEALRGDKPVGARIERNLKGLPGILRVASMERTGHLLIRYDPAKIQASRLIGLVEMNLREHRPKPIEAPFKMSVAFGLANLTLGVAAVGEFLVPGLRPLSAILLVGTNIDTFHAARRQLEKKRLGLPVLYLTIVATTLATGQFLASALMTWSFRFWHSRFRSELATERRRLLDQPHQEAILARVLTPSGTEVLVPVAKVKVGDRLVVSSGEPIPADGLILAGEGVVDERRIRGLEGISRKRVGEQLLAGSSVLAGSFHLEVIHSGDRTKAAAIRRALVAATSPTPGSSAPTIRSEAFATRAVGPTLATAGVGLLAGDLMTVGAILRPDYATGPGLAVPLETLNNVARCARLGIIAREPEALERLAEVDLFVLEDHPILSKVDLEVTGIQTRLPEAILLRYAASAFRHLVDDRSRALLAACRARKIHVLQLDPTEFGRGVTVAHENHRIRVLDADLEAGPAGTLAVEIDEVVVGLIDFKPTDRLDASSTIHQIRRASCVPFALVSTRKSEEVAALARSLGVEMYRGDFRPEDTADFLAACRKKGLKTGYVGDFQNHSRAAAEAYVAISLDGPMDLDANPGSLLIQQGRLAPLAELHAISRNHASRVILAQRMILVPNLLCVAGAFLFGFTGLTAVMLSNLGTLGLYRTASDSLRGLDSTTTPRPGQPRRAG